MAFSLPLHCLSTTSSLYIEMAEEKMAEEADMTFGLPLHCPSTTSSPLIEMAEEEMAEEDGKYGPGKRRKDSKYW